MQDSCFTFVVLCFSYGIKQVGETNRLSGKGLEADSTPGMLMGGGKWPGR